MDSRSAGDGRCTVGSSRPSRVPLVLGIAAAVVVAAVVAIWLWPWNDSSGDDTPADGFTDVAVDVVDRPDGFDAVTAQTWPFGEVGECLVQMPDRDELVPISCDEPHDLQRILVGQLDAQLFPAGSPFDDAEPRVVIRAACEAAFESFTGVAFEPSELEAPFTMPTEASWDEGDRRYQCMVFAPGRRIVGDAAAAVSG